MARRDLHNSVRRDGQVSTHDGHLSIGELAATVGVTPETIRYYEREQIIPRAQRVGTGRYRRYSRADATRLAFVKHARDLGFTLDDVRALVALDTSESHSRCEDVGSLAKNHLERVRQKLIQLNALESRLTILIDRCPVDRGGSGCGILSMIEEGMS